ncbi:MAG: S-methyl-5-thioribose-1-phosphate isomerase [Actinomycetota bacterium]|nr:S-methyl-5-thioribose-1-phosphate isomerase [Actinomycetota bacterium]
MKPVEWDDGVVRILDQTRLPEEEVYLACRSPHDVAEAIRTLAVRGAPALGVAAAMGVALAAHRSEARGPRGLVHELEREAGRLVATRPTAVNIAWAVGRVLAAVRARGSIDEIRRTALDESLRIALEDEQACLAMGALGAELVPPGANVLTHCNTGMLCTLGTGTALGVVYAAHEAGKRVHVWVDETRPVLQGARLTAWELQRMGVPMTLIADTAPGHLMAQGRVDLVIVGADRIAANGDVANKIGTYQLAVLASHHGVPFYVAAPTSSIDLSTPSGRDIRIEERDPLEVTAPRGVRFAPEGTPAANPAFDVTPARLVSAIVTEQGIVRAPYRSRLRAVVGGSRAS